MQNLFEKIRVIWEEIVSAHRQAMHARFAILVSALWALLLLSSPGKDIMRSLASGSWSDEILKTGQAPPDLDRIGWFFAGVLVLSATCWLWSRLGLSIDFLGKSQPPSLSKQRLERDLPHFYGAVPFVAAASAFASASLHEIPEASHLNSYLGALPILGLLFGVPFFLIFFGKAPNQGNRDNFGPLCWTLTIYIILAWWRAYYTQNILTALVPSILLLTPLLLYGLESSWAVFVMPIGLLIAWLAHLYESALPIAALILLSVLAILTKALAPQASKIAWVSASGNQLTLRDLFQLLVGIKKPEDKQEENTTHFLRIGGLLTLFQIGLFAAALISPQLLPFIIGSGAVLALGFAGWVTLGSALLVTTRAIRFPLVSTLLLLAAFFSLWNDNHQVRISQDPKAAANVRVAKEIHRDEPNPLKPVGTKFREWQQQISATESQGSAPEQKLPPCVIVATEGGGIRAAFWTATVLSTLQDASVKRKTANQPDFASHLFAISGISGGSIGTAFFTALCSKRDVPAKEQTSAMRLQSAQMLGRDHLAPLLGAMLYPDFAQRFLPIRLLPDRARSLEESFETAWDKEFKHQDTRMSDPFLALWNRPDHTWVPLVFMSGALVENGKRVIGSPVRICTGPGGEFVDAHDLHAHLRTKGPIDGDWQDVPLSTAAHVSARFPFFSPPGRFPSGYRTMDGGYFESSGASAGLDILNAVLATRDSEKGPTNPIILVLLRFGAQPELSDNLPTPARATSLVPIDDAARREPSHFLNETDALIGTVVRAQGARGSYAVDMITGRYAIQPDIVYSFTFSGDDIPLSWTLSGQSCKEMLDQMPETEVRPNGVTDLPTTASNREVLGKLLTDMYGQKPQAR